MRTLIFAVAALVTSASAYSQDATTPSPTGTRRDRVTLGAIATPALEGGGPWFLPAIRLSVPLGSRHGLDLDTGRVFGGSSKYADIRRQYAAQLRFLREPQTANGDARYWIAGLRYVKITKLDGRGVVTDHRRDVPLTIGYGWSHLFQSGTRAANEIGFSGGNGFMLFYAIGIQWGPRQGD